MQKWVTRWQVLLYLWVGWQGIGLESRAQSKTIYQLRADAERLYEQGLYSAANAQYGRAYERSLAEHQPELVTV